MVNETSRGKIPAEISPFLNPFAKVCIVLVIAANASAVGPKVRLDNPKIWIIGIVCILFAGLGYGCSKLAGIFGRLSPEKRTVLFFATGLRNISAATTIAIDFLPEAAALPPLLGIVFQQTMAAIMGKILLKKKSD
jgi:predicted Na+-dependent transporter